jgi:hypothetical protein
MQQVVVDDLGRKRDPAPPNLERASEYDEIIGRRAGEQTLDLLVVVAVHLGGRMPRAGSHGPGV